MTTHQDIHRHQPNFLLQGFDDATARNLHAQMELLPLVLGKVLQEPGVPLLHAYFPTTCVVSLLCGMENGSAAEIAVIGNEGLVGITNLIGGDVSSMQAVVQSTGYAYRIRLAALRQEFQMDPALQTDLLKYMQALMAQMAQTAVCNRHHTLDQQLCRWFLHCLDRLPSSELVTTQEFIAHMLGVRREGVTAAAGKLQKAGIISYRRGRISILDRAGLKAHACECYDLVRKEYQRLLRLPTGAMTETATLNGWQNETLNDEYHGFPPPPKYQVSARASL